MKNKVDSLYIHIPFCDHICDYCDFTKLQYFRNFAINYLKCLKKELDGYNIKLPLKTIYVGGGTPSCLEEDLLEELLKMIQVYTKEVIEYTFEGNPESLTEIKLQLLKKYGVNRLSIGVESTDDRILTKLNRKHSFKDVVNVIERARKIGFDNINVDLILGLPNVTENMLINDVENLLRLYPEHISCYSLTVNEHTKFYIDGVKENDDDTNRKLYDIVAFKLKENGYIHYEVSNWSKPNKESLHNLTYWNNDYYYGVGLGASGYLDKYRYSNTRNLNDYLNQIFIKEKEYITWDSDFEYAIFLNLRTRYGIDLNKFKRLYDVDFYNKYKKVIDGYIDNNFLIYNKEENRIFATYEGMMILDKIVLDLLSE